jgi:putative FmdB family regulatory protein
MKYFDYKCRECDNVFEITENSSSVCPNCKSENTFKIFHVPLVIYNSTGFTKSLTQSQKDGRDYIEDYRKNNND